MGAIPGVEMRDEVIGREPELARLTALLEGLADAGGALVLRGDAGVGKSTLLAWAAAEAHRRGTRTVTVTGVQAEFDLPYAGLHRLIGALPDAGGPAAAARDVVRAALDGDQTPVRVALALLALLHDATTDRPLLLIADDAQWLDGASWDALTFVARRLTADPVLVLAAMRTGAETTARLAGAGLAELPVEPLAGPDAVALLARRQPQLRPDVRDRILAEAAGNPLGLVELAAAGDRAGGPAEFLPLPARLERSFAASVAELPAATRTLLLVAALNDGADLNETVAAAARLEPVTADDLAPAGDAGLIETDERGTLRFRHPLVRSALRQSAATGRRRAVHAALAAVITGDTADERRTWHRAAAAAGPDERLAADLTAAAVRARRRGALAPAVTGLERAAQLSEDRTEQTSRLLWATLTAYDLGDHETVRRLMRTLADRELTPAAQARLAWLREAALGNGWSGADRLGAYIEILERMRLDGEPDLALTELSSLALRFFWSNPEERVRAQVLAAVDRFAVPADDARVIAIVAMAAPLGRGAAVVAPIERLSQQIDGTPEELDLLAVAASAVGAFPRSLTLCTAAVDVLRMQGRLGQLTQTLVTQATVAAQLGDVRLVERAGAEARALAAETGQPRWQLAAGLALGHAAALRGDGSTARHLADTAESTLLPLGAHPMLALVQLIRGVDALAEGRHAAAFDHLRPIFDPAEVPYHPVVRLWALTHLADAAVGSGREAELRPIVVDLPDVDLPVLRIARAYTAALLDPADETFTVVIDPEWPFERARLQQAYGVWLRRRRRVSEAREHLRAATAALNALGVKPWAERARAELRAAGESTPRGDDARDRLTPQELQIAMLAADGLTNRDIGERLFLSPRTISTHLYRIFPKLGVASRTELVRALIN